MATTTQLDAWLKGFPRTEAEARIKDLERELASWRNAIALYDSLTTEDTRKTEASDGKGDRVPPNRPEAIRQVLRDAGNQPTTPGTIKSTMIENGWLPDNPQHIKRFYSAMSTMTKRGHLLRLQDGRYVLPPPRQGGLDMT